MLYVFYLLIFLLCLTAKPKLMDREIIGEKEENAVSCSAIVTD
jgi:hypothetical protein